MANVIARAVVGILAGAGSLSPSFACTTSDAWLTDEEIAIVKAGGSLQWRSLLPDIPFTSPILVEGTVEADAIGGAKSELFAEADRPLDIAHSTVLAQVEQVAPADAVAPELVAPFLERSGLKRVIFACNGGMTVSPTLL